MRGVRLVVTCGLGLAIAGVAWVIMKAASEQAEATPHRKTTITVSYFHRTIRCPSCEKIQQWTEAAVKKGFEQELKDGRMIWRAANIDETGNEHFEEDYKLTMQSVIVSESDGSKEMRWKNLEKVWDLLDDEKIFTQYIQDEVRDYLAPQGEASKT